MRGCGRRQAPGEKSVDHQFPRAKGRGSLWVEYYLAERKERFRKDTESIRKTCGKVRKEFGKNSDTDCFRTLCELCFTYIKLFKRIILLY